MNTLLNHQRFRDLVFNQMEFYSNSVGDSRYSVDLEQSRHPVNEGELSLFFKCDGSELYVISFSLVPGSIFNLTQDMVLFVTRMQGVSGRSAEVRRASKAFGDISPQHLLFALLQGIAKALAVDTIVGVGAERQIAYRHDIDAVFRNAYDRFYGAVGGVQSEGDFYIVALPLQEKAMSLLPVGHRVRTRRKRAFKRKLVDSACAAWRGLMA